MKQRSRVIFLAAVLAAMGPTAAQSAQSAESTQHSTDLEPIATFPISTPRQVVKAGAELQVIVTMTNVSDQTIATSQMPFGFYFDIRDIQGNLVPFTKEHQVLLKRESTIMMRNAGVLLDSGQTWKIDINTAKMFDLSRPGKYAIQVLHKEAGVKDILKSNIISVTVVP